MEGDPFDSLLDIEQEFYQEGYDAGLADGQHAGLVEGKVFGIEKGYEKALELGRLRGRALVWQTRCSEKASTQPTLTSTVIPPEELQSLMLKNLGDLPLPKSTRLSKHIEGLISMTDSKSTAIDNSDESVTEFDDRLTRAQAKAKVIAAIVGESLRPEIAAGAQSGIEDAEGLNARH